MADTALWNRYFPNFSPAADSAMARLMAQAKLMSLPAEQTIFQPGSLCGHYLLVLEGTVRVQIVTPSGREVLLYQVQSGNACILTTSCLLGGNRYPAFGITDQAVSALAISADDFHHAIGQSNVFRTFVFAGFAQRLAHVIGRMEELVEGDIDCMLARTLLNSAADDRVRMTHQDIAVAIGSAREVVSRHLKRLEDKGWVKLARGSLDLLDRESLEKLAYKHN